MTSPTPTGSSGSATTPPPTTPEESTLIGAAQDALAAELQAVWAYPVLGPRLVDPGQVALARAADDAHGATVDALRATLSALRRTPVAPAASYPLPSALTTAAEAAAYGVALEQACAAAWRYVVVQASGGTDVGGLRTTAVDTLTATAVRAARWRAVADPTTATVAFPGT